MLLFEGGIIKLSIHTIVSHVEDLRSRYDSGAYPVRNLSRETSTVELF